MAYRLYMDGILFPVTPSKITMKINGKNETVTLINEGEANILKSPGLTDVDFELLLPAVQYPFAVYPSGFRPAKYYLDKLEALMSAKSAFQYVVTSSGLGTSCSSRWSPASMASWLTDQGIRLVRRRCSRWGAPMTYPSRRPGTA